MSEPPLALVGVRVVSFGAFVAGNTAALVLAELGADVVKVEPRGRPEVLRSPAYAIGEPVAEPSGVPNTVMYGALSRSVRSLSIDLPNPSGGRLARRLLAEADIVIENFGGSTLARWGCAYQDLLADNPDLVMLSLSGYGRSGPRAGYLAYASNICGYLGLASAWGYCHGTQSDYVTGATGALAALAALGQARRTGIPTQLDVAQIDAMAPLMTSVFADALNDGPDVPAPHNDVPGSWLAGVFPARDDDTWVAIDIEDSDDWAVLCRFLGRPDLVTADATHARTRRDDLSAALAGWLVNRSPHSAMHLLQKAGVAAAVVQDCEDIWRDPQLRVRGYMQPVAQPDLGVVTYPASVQRWSKTPGGIRCPPPRLGQHTNEILKEWLDLPDSELQRLAGSGAIFDADLDEGRE